MHSDIRENNLVFCTSGSDAYIIDFDLMARENEPYPSDYNHEYIGERHPDAKSGLGRRKEHDRISLYAILKKTAFFEDAMTQNQQDVLAKLQNNPMPLSDIATELQLT